MEGIIEGFKDRAVNHQSFELTTLYLHKLNPKCISFLNFYTILKDLQSGLEFFTERLYLPSEILTFYGMEVQIECLTIANPRPLKFITFMLQLTLQIFLKIKR